MSTAWLETVESRLDRLGHALMGWWVWPSTLLAIGTIVLVASWLFVPGPDASVTLFGSPVFPTCAVLERTGAPCGQCGMTRSWVWAARGELATAWRYNPAGLLAWVWLVASGAVGAARLARRQPQLLRWRPAALALAAVGWAAVYLVAYELRSRGIHPLP